ncbi:MAG: tetratricopeptide repeat protein [Bdellovibrionales bacterium]|nr:tetratricopeptide repeat protein [Bdellovibrionales bacterium]
MNRIRGKLFAIAIPVLVAWSSISFAASKSGEFNWPANDPNDANEVATYLYNLAVRIGELGETEEAKALYRRAIELNDQLYQAMCNLGNILLSEGKQDEAERLLKRALAIEPTDWVSWHNLSQIQVEKSDFSKALESTNESLKWSKDVELWLRKGYILEKLGQFKKALEVNLQALKLYPTNRQVLRNATLISIKANSATEAAKNLKVWTEQYPDDADIPLFRGAIEELKRGGRFGNSGPLNP